ncbi:MAG: ATP:cob(I)alamin adenosyltransferase [Candidatus Hydrogenedentes bacterium]|nr:ATP:cob(I)alamin adenosyltransferase [Candidatus Hydrogenedentota bacterium]
MRPRSQVTSKRGDKGETTTLGGDHVSKAHPVIECCGCVDELRGYTALMRHEILAEHPGDSEMAEFLWWLLHCCFAIGSQCSDPGNAHPEYRKIDIGPEHLAKLEAFQQRIEERVRLPKNFVVSASNRVAAQVDVLTTIARRLERALVRLKEVEPAFDCAHIVVFVNRLSDTLFMLARELDGGEFQTVDYDMLLE